MFFFFLQSEFSLPSCLLDSARLRLCCGFIRWCSPSLPVLLSSIQLWYVLCSAREKCFHFFYLHLCFSVISFGIVLWATLQCCKTDSSGFPHHTCGQTKYSFTCLESADWNSYFSICLHSVVPSSHSNWILLCLCNTGLHSGGGCIFLVQGQRRFS